MRVVARQWGLPIPWGGGGDLHLLCGSGIYTPPPPWGPLRKGGMRGIGGVGG